ncbi:AAA family ATPase [Pedobacter glucosidilyticus]|uniref:AAA family ATPase n=1 Tax=Pedobacter glucosidilyticus TaxID=1122941 RepID=UPI00138B010C|nr:AAA family ATPase [Pedobacter glucosidilyticus]
MDLPKPESVFSINGISLFTKKSLSLVKAKAKAGKTSAVAWMIAQMLKDKVSVIWFDTEQGSYYGSRTQHWILSIAFLDSSEFLQYYDLKTLSPNERLEAIEQILYNNKPEVVVIDGVRDLVSSINNEDQVSNVITHLMQWVENYNCHIINILHQNKSDNNARGHLGTELNNKVEIALKVETDAINQILISPELSRGLPFEGFALGRSDAGIPYLIKDWLSPESAKTKNKKPLPTQIDYEFHVSVLQKVFHNEHQLNGSNFYNEFIVAYNSLVDATIDKMVYNRSREFLNFYVREKYLCLQKGKRNNEILYELNPEKEDDKFI